MRIASKGQVTIPPDIRKKLGLHPNTEVEFEIVGNSLRIRKVRGRSRRGGVLLSRMRGKGVVRMSTDEILALTRGFGERDAVLSRQERLRLLERLFELFDGNDAEAEIRRLKSEDEGF